MKKTLSLILALIATTFLWAYDFQSGDLYYFITSSSEPYTIEVSNAVSSITTATIPEIVTYNGITYNVTSIGDHAFSRCDSLTSITIPKSVMSIRDFAFYNCSSLTSITIPNSVTSIENSAFSGCSALISITIPNSVTSIGNSAFSGCSSLTSITIPNSVTSIGNSAFSYCESLTSITIPNSVTSIGYRAFRNCPSLTSMVVESGNTIYDSRKNCNAIIETVTNTLIAGCQNTIIPNSVTSIGYSAFHGCSSLTSITIPNSVTGIGNYAFSGCSSLTSITIPNSVTSIGYGAFSYCTSLSTVICKAVNVPNIMRGDVFYDVPQATATLYVPAESLDLYKSAEQWKEFGTILPIEELPAAVENTLSSSSTTNPKKLLRNGQVYILQDGKTYTITGQKL